MSPRPSFGSLVFQARGYVSSDVPFRSLSLSLVILRRSNACQIRSCPALVHCLASSQTLFVSVKSCSQSSSSSPVLCLKYRGIIMYLPVCRVGVNRFVISSRRCIAALYSPVCYTFGCCLVRCAILLCSRPQWRFSTS